MKFTNTDSKYFDAYWKMKDQLEWPVDMNVYYQVHEYTYMDVHFHTYPIQSRLFETYIS